MPAYITTPLAENTNMAGSLKITSLVIALLVALFFVSSKTYANEDVQTIDLNAANALTLIEIETISISLASAIVRYREQHGPFNTAEDLLSVPGVTEDSIKNLQFENDGKGGLIATMAETEYTDNNMELPNY